MSPLLVKLIPAADLVEESDLAGTTAIVFDILRATSTIVTALACGFRQVYPVISADKAAKLAKNSGFLLAGERGGEKIKGFAHGNSPLEFCSGPIPNRDILVLTTSNGTRAIRQASAAVQVIIGALLNARAVALNVLREGRDLRLVCAGTAGEFSFEDALGAGFVLFEMAKLAGSVPEMDDLAMAAYGLACGYCNDPLAGLVAGQHGKRLLHLGRDEDLRWCAQLNRYHIAPILVSEYIE